MKQLKVALLAGLMVACLGQAWAEIGVVDPEKVGMEYKKAKEFGMLVKGREDELTTLRNNLAKQLKDQGEKMTPVEKKNLEDKLSKQFEEKFIEYRNWFAAQDQALRTEVEKAIGVVSSTQKLDMVISKQVVLTGGRDVTDEVIKVLNK